MAGGSLTTLAVSVGWSMGSSLGTVPGGVQGFRFKDERMLRQ